jgi:hypothetical protein
MMSIMEFGPASLTSPTMQQIFVVPISSPTTKSFLLDMIAPRPWFLSREILSRSSKIEHPASISWL